MYFQKKKKQLIPEQDELKKKDNEVKELTQELETLRHIVSDVEDQKDKELKILVAAIYELAQTKLDLEKQLASRDGYNPLSRGTNSLTVPQVEESKQRSKVDSYLNLEIAE